MRLNSAILACLRAAAKSCFLKELAAGKGAPAPAGPFVEKGNRDIGVPALETPGPSSALIGVASGGRKAFLTLLAAPLAPVAILLVA